MALPVSYADVLQALPRVQALLRPTPLYAWPGLLEQLGCRFWLKHENHQPVGAFKVRGGVNLVSSLNQSERVEGIMAVSTGNHGQSLAFAARHFGVPCTIVVPVGNNPDKNLAMCNLGAQLIEHGRDFDEAREYLEEMADERGARYVHSANEPQLIAGVGTMAWEIFESRPDPDVILVPIGLGSGVCGTCIVAKERRPATKVIGVQATGAAAVAKTWQTGQWHTTDAADTWAEGMATRVPAEMTMDIMRQLMDDVILVTDDEISQAVYLILQHTHNLAEGAGAAALAAALKHSARFQGQEVVGILSGGNMAVTQLSRVLTTGAGRK